MLTSILEFGAETLSWGHNMASQFTMELTLFVVAVTVHLSWSALKNGMFAGESRKSAIDQPHARDVRRQPRNVRLGRSYDDPRVQGDKGAVPAPRSPPSLESKLLSSLRQASQPGNVSALQAYHKYCEKGGKMTSPLWDAVLGACVQQGNVEDAKEVLEKMEEVGVVSTHSYCAYIRVRLEKDHYDCVKHLLETLRARNFMPDLSMYNETILGFAKSKYPPRRRFVWRLVDQMRAEGLNPNTKTCAIILKHTQPKSTAIDIARAMELADSLVVDEALLVSIIDVHMRLGKPELLAPKLHKMVDVDGVKVESAVAFLSLIKAYGFVGNSAGVWKVWEDFRSHCPKLSSSAVCCLVEAACTVGDVARAHDTVLSILEDKERAHLIDSGIYGLLVKGAGKAKQLDRMFLLFDEMVAQGMKPTTIIFNVLIDSCTHTNDIGRVTELFKSMEKHRCEPSMITYGTLIKAHCMNKDLDSALGILQDVRGHPKLQPDEVIYKTLMDGCADMQRRNVAEKLMQEMQAEGLPVTGYVLTRMVRILGREGAVDEAFELVARITARYGFKMNFHICNELVEACLQNGQPMRAAKLSMQVLREYVDLDPKLFYRLIMSLMHEGHGQQAVNLFIVALRYPTGRGPCEEQTKKQLPDGSDQVLSTWRQVLKESTRSLYDDSLINEVFEYLLGDGYKGDHGVLLARQLFRALKAKVPDHPLPAHIENVVGLSSSNDHA